MIYDISMSIKDGMPGYGGSSPFRRVVTRDLGRGDSCNEARLEMSAHDGTHVDAPLHFVDGGGAVDAIPPEVLVGPARVLHFPAADRIDRADLEGRDWAGVARVLFRTRNSDRWKRGEGFEPDYVHLTGDGAKFLVERKVKLVGTDGLGIEKYRSGDHPTHRTLLGAGIVVVEGLCLADVPPGDYTLFCGPLKVAGGDGAPARAFLYRELTEAKGS